MSTAHHRCSFKNQAQCAPYRMKWAEAVHLWSDFRLESFSVSYGLKFGVFDTLLISFECFLFCYFVRTAALNCGWRLLFLSLFSLPSLCSVHEWRRGDAVRHEHDMNFSSLAVNTTHWPADSCISTSCIQLHSDLMNSRAMDPHSPHTAGELLIVELLAQPQHRYPHSDFLKGT